MGGQVGVPKGEVEQKCVFQSIGGRRGFRSEVGLLDLSGKTATVMCQRGHCRSLSLPLLLSN